MDEETLFQLETPDAQGWGDLSGGSVGHSKLRVL